MRFLFLSMLLSLSVSAQTFHGSTTGAEVEPVYGHDGEDSYRSGSTHLNNLSIEYDVQFKKIGPGSDIILSARTVKIDSGFTAYELLTMLLSSTPTSVSVSFQKAVMTSTQLGNGYKHIVVSAEATYIDHSELEESLLKTQITNFNELTIDPSLPLELMNLEVCVSQERRGGAVLKFFGCSSLREKKSMLEWLNLRWIRRNRRVNYEFYWSVKGHGKEWKTPMYFK